MPLVVVVVISRWGSDQGMRRRPRVRRGLQMSLSAPELFGQVLLFFHPLPDLSGDRPRDG